MTTDPTLSSPTKRRRSPNPAVDKPRLKAIKGETVLDPHLIEGLEGHSGGYILSEQDAKNLGETLTLIDPARIMDHTTSDGRRLRDLVKSTGSQLEGLRTSIHQAILSISPNSSTSAEIDHFKRSASELLDALEHKYALAATAAENVDQIEDGPPAKRFMLHRSLADFDLFTSAVDLTASELEELASVEDTDVIAVVPTTPSFSSQSTSRTFSDINSKPKAPRRIGPVAPLSQPVPVSLLYYDPYSSFAPTHDSTGANLTYTQSTTYRSSKTLLKEWDLEPTTFVLPTASTSILPSVPLVLTSEEESTLESLGIDPSEMVQGWEMYEEGQRGVVEELEKNTERLRILVNGQWDRLRKGKGIVAGEIEGKTATDLLQSLSHLISSISPSTTLNSTSILPTPERIEALLPFIMQSLAREANYQGTLDGANFRAVRERDLIGRGEGEVMVENA